MTINKLHKILGQMIADGNGRCKACVDKSTFGHRLESDGCVVIPVEDAEIKVIEISDGDGGTEVLADGTVKQELLLVLSGDWEATK